MMAGLVAGWLLWSLHFDPLLLGLGLASCVAVTALALRLRIVDPESVPLEILPGLLTFVPWLLVEIAKANLHVVWVILAPGLPIRPQLLRVRASQRTELGQTVYANSITLTPGTVSLDVRGGQILVHALTDATAEDLRTGRMDRRVCQLEGQSA